MSSPDPSITDSFHAIGDGFSYGIRPIQKSDRDGLIELFNHLSPENRYLRFAHAISKLPDDFLADILDLDYLKEMALVAFIGSEAEKYEIIGIARYVSEPTGSTCEFSISVSDQYAAHGVGMNLMTHLIDYAKQKGLYKMIGYILSDNVRMLRMVRELGFHIDAPTNESEFKLATLELQQ